VTGYVLRRAALSVGVFVVLAVLTYLGIAALPGDACTALLGKFATAGKLAQCRAEHGLAYCSNSATGWRVCCAAIWATR
jgi:peptide/nickel transport system permease protein